jgi:hypothetical protein
MMPESLMQSIYKQEIVWLHILTDKSFRRNEFKSANSIHKLGKWIVLIGPFNKVSACLFAL